MSEPHVPLEAAELLHVSLSAALMSKSIKDPRARSNLERVVKGYRRLRDDSLREQGFPASTASDYSGSAAESISAWLDEKAAASDFLEYADAQFEEKAVDPDGN